jgi:hypothetical protein
MANATLRYQEFRSSGVQEFRSSGVQEEEERRIVFTNYQLPITNYQ